MTALLSVPMGKVGGTASWSFDPFVVVPVAALAVAYAIGTRRLARRRANGSWREPRAAAFAFGLAALVVALISPLEALSQDLLSAHMAQHLLLVIVAAPLLVIGRPGLRILLALPVGWRRTIQRLGAAAPAAAVRRVLTHPVGVWAMHVTVLWAWHVPSLYEAAVRNELLHALEHVTFLGTAVLFWWVLAAPARPGRRAIGRGPDVLYAAGAGVQGAALGALLTFATSPLYGIYVERAARHGVSALQDQQVAGLVMWIPAGVIYLIAAGVLFVRWIQSVENETRLEENRLELAGAK